MTYGTSPPGANSVEVEVFVIAIVGGTGSRTVDSQSSAVACTHRRIGRQRGLHPSGSGSQLVLGDVTVAVFGTMPSGSMALSGNGSAASVTMSNVMSSPAASDGVEQVTTWAASAVQPLGGETNVRPTGSGSVTTTSVAGAADTFVTVNVYGTVDPGVIRVTLDDLLSVSSGVSDQVFVAVMGGGVAWPGSTVGESDREQPRRWR